MTIELSASYRLIDDLHASLILESDQRPGIVLSVLHERYAQEPVCYDFAGHDQQQLQVTAGESLTIVVRCQGRVIASLVNEVDCRENSRLLLHPKGGYNLLVYQSRVDDLPPPRNLLPDDVCDASSQQSVPTPATARLAETLEIVNRRYAVRQIPRGLSEFLPVVSEAVSINEEDHSRQIADLFRQAIADLRLDIAPAIKVALHP